MAVLLVFVGILAFVGCVTFLVLWLTERSAAAKRIDEADRLREARSKSVLRSSAERATHTARSADHHQSHCRQVLEAQRLQTPSHAA